MDALADLAVARQSFETLLSMYEPKDVHAWNPSKEQRNEYVRLCGRILDGLDSVEGIEQSLLLNEGRVQSYVPEAMLTFVREHMKPQMAHIKAALDHLDPDSKELRDFFYEFDRTCGARFSVRGSFEEGLEQIYQLLDRNPEWGDDHPFVPEKVREILESKLISFEPDAWLGRAHEILPIRTTRSNVDLPMHVRVRLEELYRAYVFGLWLSVLGLCRSILEYAILDNLHKYNIDPSWAPDREGSRKEKKLSHLVDEVTGHSPNLKKPMDRLRDLGNEYLHPKKSRVSKESLLQRESAARTAMSTLVQVVEDLYRSRGEI